MLSRGSLNRNEARERAAALALRMPWTHIIGSGASIERPAGDALVAAAKLDRRQFDLLYRNFLDPIYRYCYRRTGTVHAAEDATQQVFLLALARLDTCRNETFQGWLFTIARNVTATMARSARPSTTLEEIAEIVPHSGPS